MPKTPSLHRTSRSWLLDGPLATLVPAYVAGTDPETLALWLGHESPTTTHHYVEADLAMKDRALSRLQQPEASVRRYKAPALMEFLKTL